MSADFIKKSVFLDGLYSKTQISEDNKWDILHLFFVSEKDRIDHYCPKCREGTIYKGMFDWPKYGNEAAFPRVADISTISPINGS